MNQMNLLEWGAENPQPEAKKLPQAIAPPDLGFSIGDVVSVAPRTGDRPFMFMGQVVAIKHNLVGVQIGVGEPYFCSPTRCTQYTGVVSLWRLGAAIICDHPDCRPQQSARPFDCSVCGERSRPNWWYVGHMATKTSSPKWPDAVWYPADYDPNHQEFTDEQLG